MSKPNISELMKNKELKIVSSEEALKDVEPFIDIDSIRNNYHKKNDNKDPNQ